MDPSFFNNAAFNNISNMKQATAQHLDFSKPEVQLICELLSKDLPAAEQERVKKLMNLLMG